MFTGLIEGVGHITQIDRRGEDARLVVGCSFSKLVLGESIAVDGACLTVDERLDGAFAAMASAETLRRTTLGRLRPGSKVHLERALAFGGRLGGHLVTGHVDAMGRVRERTPRGSALRVDYELPLELEPFVAEKGSITIDGVSLTVNGLSKGAFWVMLVPFTRSETHLDRKGPGDFVNLETDVLAKYVARLLSQRGRWETNEIDEADGTDLKKRSGGGERGVTMDLLLKQGFGR